MTPPAVQTARERFAADLAISLARRPRQVSPQYLYDALGSALFEAIGYLPWYKVTRSEHALIESHASAILGPLRRPLTLAELGCGNGEKIAALIERAAEPVELVQLVDVSAAALQKARDRLAALPVGDLVTHQGAYEDGLLRIGAARRGTGAMLVLFLGSNLGNFDPPAARDLLVRIRACLRPGDALLLGTDLVKPERDLLRAYDDPLGVTAAFNRNLLRRINDELGGTFDLAGFAHRAVWNAAHARVEMHLVSLRRQSVRIAAADLDLTFEQDDWIWTESSYKYEPAGVLAEGRAAGFSRGDQWIDRDARFALTRFDV